MRRSEFQRDGLVLSVAETGSGQPFVFQHGLCGAAGQPAEVFPPDIGWRCVTLECRGHGASDAGDSSHFSIRTFANDIEAFIRARETTPVVVGGISMGAAIALRLAVTAPDLVRALVLARPAWVAENAPANMAPNAEVGAFIRDQNTDDAERRFAETATARRLAKDAPDNLASLMGFFRRQPLDVTAALLTRISADGPGLTRDEIARIRVPTLVIGHGRDTVHPLSMAEELTDLITGARLAVITPKADDLARYRHDFRSALSSFLKEI